ncbi:hypothetical protein DW624_RS00805 [Enterococcus hirae]
MKTIWQYGRTGGKELEVCDSFTVQVPYTNIAPLENIDIEDQFFIPSENRWKEIINRLDREKLDNLEKLYEALEDANEKLQQKADSIAQINSKTMLAVNQNASDIAEIKEQLNAGGTKQDVHV